MSERRGGGFRSGGDRGRNNGGFRGRRDDNRGGDFRRDQGPREMHKATCAECGNECEVPFKPSGDRPVYCRECFNKHRKF
jgi:CxxC-x17-CxxC domain-containing protein